MVEDNKEINKKYITVDLLRDIISWVPLDALREFSKASPIVDHEIKAQGIRVFYNGDRITDLVKFTGIVILLRSKKEFVKVLIEDYLAITNNAYYNTMKINRNDRVDDINYWQYDIIQNIAIGYANDLINIVHGKPNEIYNDIVIGRPNDPKEFFEQTSKKYIDIDSGILLETYEKYKYNTFETWLSIDTFKVLL